MIGTVKVISGSAHPELARDICKHLGIDLCPTTVVRFSNENMLVQIDENVREGDVFVIQPSCPPVSDGIIELLMTIDALRHASAGRITAVLPYFPYARSDKKDRPRISITARLMADLIQTAGANRILTMNLHSPQTQGFFRIPADQLEAEPILCDYLRQSRDLSRYVLVAGDVGEAALHASHPVQEIGGRIFGPVKRVDAGLGERVQEALRRPRRDVDRKVKRADFERNLDATVALLDEAMTRVVPPGVVESLGFKMAVLREMLGGLEKEYDEAYKNGWITQIVEYHDAYAFFVRIRALYLGLAPALGQTSPSTPPASRATPRFSAAWT